jgi:hypothetical protein
MFQAAQAVHFGHDNIQGHHIGEKLGKKTQGGFPVRGGSRQGKLPGSRPRYFLIALRIMVESSTISSFIQAPGGTSLPFIPFYA